VLVNRSVAALATGRGVHLGALTHVLAGRYGEREAVEDPAPTPGFDHASVRTFQDLEEVVARSAAALLDAGVGTGDRVLVLLDNRLDVALMAFAVARLGALPIPVNHRLTGREVGAIVDATGAGHALADPAYVDGLPVELAVVTSDGLGAAVRHAPQARLAPDPAADPEATAILLTTSGTTGTPKAAALTSRGLLKALGRLVALPVGWPRGPRGGRDRVLAVLPLTHVMGLSTLLGALAAGVPLVRRARFDPHEVLDLIEQRRPNAVVAVPTMYADLETAGAAGRDLGSVQLWVSAADAMPTERARRFQRYGAAMRVAGVAVGSAAFLDVFGMVELSGPAAVRLLPPSVVGAAPVPGLALALPGVGSDRRSRAPRRWRSRAPRRARRRVLGMQRDDAVGSPRTPAAARLRSGSMPIAQDAEPPASRSALARPAAFSPTPAVNTTASSRRAPPCRRRGTCGSGRRRRPAPARRPRRRPPPDASIVRRSLSPHRPLSPLRLFSSVSTSSSVMPACRTRWNTTAGSTSPERVPMTRPSSGDRPIEVSTLRPPRSRPPRRRCRGAG
jgi:acyl-CoA synthetase (AMP-forming)/AMP-acid ligase II